MTIVHTSPAPAAPVRSREKNGWQAKAPAPQKPKPLRTNVGQTLSSVNTAIPEIVSQLRRKWAFAAEGRLLVAPEQRQCQVLLSLARRGNKLAPRLVSSCESCGTPDAQLNSEGDPMKLFTTFCCAALALCSAVYAQSPADRITVHFNTPVIVGETKLPAGDCDIQVMRGTSDTIILVLRSQAGPYTAAVAI